MLSPIHKLYLKVQKISNTCEYSGHWIKLDSIWNSFQVCLKDTAKCRKPLRSKINKQKKKFRTSLKILYLPDSFSTGVSTLFLTSFCHSGEPKEIQQVSESTATVEQRMNSGEKGISPCLLSCLSSLCPNTPISSLRLQLAINKVKLSNSRLFCLQYLYIY